MFELYYLLLLPMKERGKIFNLFLIIHFSFRQHKKQQTATGYSSRSFSLLRAVLNPPS
jgi:hypothetical protein